MIHAGKYVEYRELQVAMKKGNFQDLERHINKHLEVQTQWPVSVAGRLKSRPYRCRNALVQLCFEPLITWFIEHPV